MSPSIVRRNSLSRSVQPLSLSVLAYGHHRCYLYCNHKAAVFRNSDAPSSSPQTNEQQHCALPNALSKDFDRQQHLGLSMSRSVLPWDVVGMARHDPSGRPLTKLSTHHQCVPNVPIFNPNTARTSHEKYATRCIHACHVVA